jgi:O-antigen/teichoic acid export membrane protein
MRLLRWSASRYGAAGVAAVSAYSGDLILGVLVSPAATGPFRASNRIATAASDIFAQPAVLLVRTALARCHARGAGADHGWQMMLAGIAMIGWPVLADLALLAGWIAAGVLGPAWAGAAGRARS